jgi:hypothetical protein
MRVETISRALIGLGNDSEMWQRLIELRVALDDVLAADGVPCKHCGAVARVFEIGKVPLLAERLASVVGGMEQRDRRGDSSRRRSAGRDWRRRPDIRTDAGNWKSRGGLGEVSR